MFDHTRKSHLSGPKHANVPMSIRGPVRPKQHERDREFEKAQLKKDEPKPAKPIEPAKRKAVPPFPGDKTEK